MTSPRLTYWFSTSWRRPSEWPRRRSVTAEETVKRVATLLPHHATQLKLDVNERRLGTALHLNFLAVASWFLAWIVTCPVSAQVNTFAGNPQHTAIFTAPAQHLNKIRWSTPIDTAGDGGLAHYGAPLITTSNTVIVPVRTAAGFKLQAFDGATGGLKYTLLTDYVTPSSAWVPVLQPVIATSPFGDRLYFAGAGGTVYWINNIDSDNPSTPVHECFYTDIASYQSNQTAFDSSVFVNTALTADDDGDIFFGFRVDQPAPAPLIGTNGGFARLDANGLANFVLARDAADDPQISRDSHNSAPALSNDGETLYVAVKGAPLAFYGYLLGLDSATLATKYQRILLDPRDGNYAGILDISTASPTIGPDGDVFFGVLGYTDDGNRGFMLHFNSDLSTEKTPSGFGWDYTAAIVPTNMVPSYQGPSSYLIFSKYNNYAIDDGDGIHRIALLDPNTTQIDPHPTAGGLVEMREVMTAIACRPDNNYQPPNPYAVNEWCVNSAAVNPPTRSVFAPSEDGRIYRWDLAENSLAETVVLDPGEGEPYVPTVIGPDGTIYTIHAGELFALGAADDLDLFLTSSKPDLRTVVQGEPITFTAIVTNRVGITNPTGTVTFEDLTYAGLTAITNVLAASLPLSNGVASVTVSNLTTGTNYLGNHFISAIYSGDSLFAGGKATRVQKVHRGATTTTLSSAPLSSNLVTFTATVARTNSENPSGMVLFRDGSQAFAQTPLNSNGLASVTVSLPSGSHNVSAEYSSDTLFASSVGTVVGSAATLNALVSNGVMQLSFTNSAGASFDVLASDTLLLSMSNWTNLGRAAEVVPGQFRFVDIGATNYDQRFYRVIRAQTSIGRSTESGSLTEKLPTLDQCR